MKIAISGKGGVGKTTLAGVMARILGERGYKVIAIDADPDSNLASAIGIGEEKMKSLQPLAQMKEFIEERTGAKKGSYGAFFQLNPRVDDIPERYSVEKDGVRLILLGNIPQGGGGCFCAENALLRSLMAYVMIEREEYVIVDMEAGLEHLGRGTTEYMDALIVVVEPGRRSFQTAYQIKRLSEDLNMKRVYIVGNKIVDEADRLLIRESLKDLPYLGDMIYNEKVAEADKKGVSPYDTDARIKTEVEQILYALEQEVE
ncbi:MAG TPA: carbon monoxide dehydrogenase accessory protein CooC [Syntrophorhabdaceae bacterium]|nr:carbon monoxide dehydrogenase accessory protein CooC [Syntrophorhabdaceae bacterium]HQM81991.1 carbon monoxide dehydrogenase accessory protein CooC [Syntrophorhabdaceae bacterium]